MRRRPPRRSSSTVLQPVTSTSSNLSGTTTSVDTKALIGLIVTVQGPKSGDENSERVSAAKMKTRQKDRAVAGSKTGRSSMFPPPTPQGKGKGRAQGSCMNADKRRRSGTFTVPVPSLLDSASTATCSDVSMLDASPDGIDVERAVLAPPPHPVLIPSHCEVASGHGKASLDSKAPKPPLPRSRNAPDKRPSTPSVVVKPTPSNDVEHVAPTRRTNKLSQTRLSDSEKAKTGLSSKTTSAPTGQSKHSSVGSLRRSSSVKRTEAIRKALAEVSLPSTSKRNEGQSLPSISIGDSIGQGSHSSSRSVTPLPTLSSNRTRPSASKNSSAASSRSISRQPPSQSPIATQQEPPSTDPFYRPPPRMLGMGVRRISSAPTAPHADRPLPTQQKGFKPPLLTGSQVPKSVERPPLSPRKEPSSDDTSFDCSFDLDPEELDNAMQEFD
ncbi:uncharacterized protein BT62DRAFT_689066 [Guyanagaster necrorhizus]|uniref:Uncharacterized protein n=1 Tax=Guyanagaster necrorhizus TaxID=856835 RepID=A0A9P7VFM1_9AGAR|nr:uncharacterized protein BT62DRAFT_689066 [Guyanagaster necrorhizus MCA 3950]KAG7439824.1 hypothetical protein BT62DRAFT_689066 [Guyanagaster necrorhizus MCA 3950]